MSDVIRHINAAVLSAGLPWRRNIGHVRGTSIELCSNSWASKISPAG